MTSPPRVWLLLGQRHGDNAQLRALAADLGAESREIQLDFNGFCQLPNAALGASLLSLRGRPAEAAPPWPDLVIGIGRRSVPAARWLRARSGGRTRLVHMGRPRAHPRHFDLLLTTGQYAMPDAANLIRLALPWQAPLAEPPAAGPARHVLAVLGGDSWTVRLDEATAGTLLHRARAAAARHGLPLAVATSPRTPPRLAAALRARLGSAERFYDWHAAGGRDNPYREWLGQAAEIVLTGDSVSALSDAVWTGCPVQVVAAPERPWLRLITRPGTPLRIWRRRGGNLALGAPPPDLDALFADLEARGLAQPDPEGGWRLPPCCAALEAERHAALARLRALLPCAE
ncbi:ELM1/GtrOC1 family putative glycosyltransferase [Maritimibacter sp. 55A14]|uniref:ELM1/GtrOC1 family putative glycosyltransferase n=1 Tax=Maritimibacter sp. 55A14 TaxID=2174844 RepID=UPI001304A98A|nr:ELM1/GtrOC1 family putative glycosyltransferase [Maritimibacter sp. 55A14]